MHDFLLYLNLFVCAGSLDIAAKAMEVDIAKAGLHMLIEKPISMRPAEEVERLAQVVSLSSSPACTYKIPQFYCASNVDHMSPHVCLCACD